MKRFSILLTAVLIALPLAAQTRQAEPAAAATSASEGTLVGSWVATVNVDPTLGVPPFKELYTFHSDGTLTMVDDNAPAPPFPFTPGHGVWKRAAGGGFAYKIVNLLYDPASYASNGYSSILNNVKVDGDSFSGSGHAKFYGPDGALMFEADATITAERITIDQP
jgi:hypothetical protein